MRKWDFYTTKEIKPRGWMKRQLEIQAAGLSGNLDKIWPDVRDSAWIGGTCEGWERVPYWLDGFIPLAYLLRDEDMIGRAKRYVDAILEAQQSDGWICPCPKEDRGSYDTWAVLLITKVLTVYYDCSADERVPNAVYRVLKNYHELLKTQQLHLFDWGKFRWYEGFIAIDFVYKHYPENWLLELAEILRDQGANYPEFLEIWKRPLNWWRLDTHIVNVVMAMKYEAESCQLLRHDYQDRAQQMYDVLRAFNGTPVEIFTGDECLSGLSPIQGTELCAVVELMYSYERLFAYTGDRKWAERLEVIAFNALPASISDDMWSHQYVQMSNQIACERFPGKSLFRTNNEEAHLFGLEPNFGCCTANFGQGWPKLAISAFLHRDDTVLSAWMLPVELHDSGKHIVLETNYPFENQASYTIRAEEDFEFQIRVPSFAQSLLVNGVAHETEDISFRIKAGEEKVIELRFRTEPYMVQRPYGLSCVQSGSLVFALPISYTKVMHEYERNGVERKYPYCDYEYQTASDWSFAYCGTTLTQVPGKVGDTPFSSEEPPVTVQTTVVPIQWGMEDGYEKVCAKVPGSTEATGAPQLVRLYPYGCTRLRMTELPVCQQMNGPEKRS